MPFYEYQCKQCGHEFEAMQKISEGPLRKCPACGKSALQRLMSAPVFRLKGSGWYETDFKSDQEGKRNLAEQPEAPAAKDESKDAKEGKDGKDGKEGGEVKEGKETTEAAKDSGASKEKDKDQAKAPAASPPAKSAERPPARPAKKAAAAKPAKRRPAAVRAKPKHKKAVRRPAARR